MTCSIITLLIVLVLAVVPGVAILLMIVHRRRSFYRRAIAYDVRADYELPDVARVIELEAESQGVLSWPVADIACGAALLEIRIESTGAGLVDPFLETQAGNVILRHYFERGAAGRRFLNVTEQVRRAAAASGRLTILAKHLKSTIENARLHVFKEEPAITGPILVLAPHPDDAEIAAFGLMMRHDSWVATVTVGDNGPSQYAAFFDSAPDAYLEKARIRVWDSLNIPQLAGVPAHQIVNLGYFDGMLPQMAAAPDTPVSGEHTRASDIALLRRFPFDTDARTRDATWRNLVCDMRKLLDHVQPTVIVTPHPQLDPHGDHRFTTIAMLEALEQSDLRGRLLLYANHAIGSELYPYGPRDGVITVPPLYDKNVAFSGLLSLELDRLQRLRKQVAIEAQHDLQSPPPTVTSSVRRTLRRALRDIYCQIVVPDNDYVRRAVRRNELYFVADFADAAELRCRSLRE
jgi:LmbE family N-acetylglucosaminyl deacetylase